MLNNNVNPFWKYCRATWLTTALLLAFSASAQAGNYSVNVLKDKQLGHHLLSTAENETLSSPPEIRSGLNVITGRNGTRQVTYRGKPLYRRAKDASFSQHNGHKRNKEGRKYSIANIEPTISTLTTNGNTRLVGPDGMTLYAMIEGRESMQDCVRGCADNWPPLVTGTRQPMASTKMEGKIGTIKRLPPDNRLQVTYEGRPLHYWSRDSVPGDATGHGIGGIWFQVSP